MRANPCQHGAILHASMYRPYMQACTSTTCWLVRSLHAGMEIFCMAAWSGSPVLMGEEFQVVILADCLCNEHYKSIIYTSE